MPGDNIPMSPATGRNSCYLGAYVASTKWTGPYHQDFEELMREYEGRPHWGKLFSRTPRDFAELYPQYRQFDAFRRERDPNGIFRNVFVERVFGEPISNGGFTDCLKPKSASGSLLDKAYDMTYHLDIQKPIY